MRCKAVTRPGVTDTNVGRQGDKIGLRAPSFFFRDAGPKARDAPLDWERTLTMLCQWRYVFSITIETSLLKIATGQNTGEKSKYIMAAVGCPHLWACLLLEGFHQKVFVPPYVTLAQQRLNSWLRVGTPSSSFSEKQGFVVVRNVHARSTSLGFKSLFCLLATVEHQGSYSTCLSHAFSLEKLGNYAFMA